MDRTIKYIVIIITLTSSVMIVLSATDSSALLNGLLIGTGAVSIVVVLWYLFLPKLANHTRIKTMKILYAFLIMMACGFYITSKIYSWQAWQIEKARQIEKMEQAENSASTKPNTY